MSLAAQLIMLINWLVNIYKTSDAGHQNPAPPMTLQMYSNMCLAPHLCVCVCVCVEKPTHLHFVPVFILSVAAV